MKRNSFLLMLLICFISMFCFNLNVYAVSDNYVYGSDFRYEKKSSSYIEMIKKGKKVKRDEKILDDAAADDLVKIEFEDNKFTICTDGKFLGDDKLSEYLHLGVNLVKILVPLILLVLGSLDFAKAIFAQDDAAMNKAQKTFIKRLIIAVVIFVIPGLLKVILNIAHGIWPIVDNSLCGII